MGVLGRRAIKLLIPHRWLFLLVDKAEVDEIGETITGWYYVRKWHPIWLLCHFPGNPIFPGVFMLEAMAQVAGIWEGAKAGQPVFGYFRSVDQVSFRTVLRPGNWIRIEVKQLNCKSGVIQYGGEVYLGDELACRAKFILANPMAGEKAKVVEPQELAVEA